MESPAPPAAFCREWLAHQAPATEAEQDRAPLSEPPVWLWVDLPGGGRKQIWCTFDRKKDAESYPDQKSPEVRDGDLTILNFP